MRSLLLHLALLLSLSAGSSCGFSPGEVDGSVPTGHASALTTFESTSFVIPMDTTYQPTAVLRAFGLVNRLLENGVKVYWIVNPAKVVGGTDLTATTRDFTGGAALSKTYRGGPFVIDVAGTAAATPIITQWRAEDQAAGLSQTVVHVATASFSGEVARTLVAAPRIGAFADGKEDVAFGYFNAARIRESNGASWPTGRDTSYPGHPDILTEAQVAGATTSGAADGVLMDATGHPTFCQLTSMHYGSANSEVVREVRMWLQKKPTHAFMECEAVRAFENNANGHFLTTGGIDGDTQPSTPVVRLPASPFAQFDGPLVSEGGSLPGFKLAAGSTLYTTNAMLANQSGQPITSRMMWLTGFVDGNTSKGKVSYLSGHQYTTTTPIAASNSTNGTRFFLDSLFESPCTALEDGAPDLTIVASSPAFTNGSTITYTFAVTNVGTQFASNVTVTAPVPAGATFVSATGGGTLSGGTVTFDLGYVDEGTTETVSFTVSVSADATYASQGTVFWKAWRTPHSLTSNSASTVRDTGPPNTSIVSGPPALSRSSSATFDFASTEGGTFQCSLDGGPFATCADPASFTGLGDASHTVAVRAVDLSGNVDATPASFTWTVDAVNDPPVANADTASTNEDTAVTVDVIANDTSGADSGETLSLSSVAPAGNGTTAIVAGRARYTPTLNFYGSDTFTYVVRDDRGGVATGTVTITVIEVNDPPTPANDAVSVLANSVDNVVNVLGNDSSAPDPAETLTVTSAGPAARGVVTVIGGVVRYTPQTGFIGADSFAYTISDGRGGTASATVAVTVLDSIPPNVLSFSYSLLPHPYSEAAFVDYVSAGVTVRATVRSDEALSAAELRFTSGATVLSFPGTVSSATGSWDFALNATPPPGSYAASVRVVDVLGNGQVVPVTLAAPGFVAVDNIASPCTLLNEDGTPACMDFDGDGSWGSSAACPAEFGDCDDTNPTVHMYAPEIPGDGVDNGCAGGEDWPVDETIGVFVSPSGSVGGDGSRAAPLASLRDALGLAASTGRVVFAAQGSYTDGGAPLVIGVSLFGAFDSSWERTPLTQSAVSITAPAVVTAELVVGIELDLSGGGSIAVTASPLTTLIDTRVLGSPAQSMTLDAANRMVRTDVVGPALTLASGSLVAIHGTYGSLVQQSDTALQLARCVVGPITAGHGSLASLGTFHDGPLVGSGANLRISTSTFRVAGAAISMVGGTVIAANTLFDGTAAGIAHDGSTITWLRNNLFDAACPVSSAGSCVPATCGSGGNLCGSASFAGASDYHLQSGSVGIDAGMRRHPDLIATTTVVDMDGACAVGEQDIGADQTP